ncbi:hypothetical protein Nepgr_012806 [Nepenthes gracilis]|uniref:BZIP domain-containing protein n=1 Tax=Nepenthes gracilis TaxID=150966 RepID=A0AAD3XNP6_NEPGR|nr:hypothetical protein Nepgr_012806 [Nepenthes gracilis]
MPHSIITFPARLPNLPHQNDGRRAGSGSFLIWVTALCLCPGFSGREMSADGNALGTAFTLDEVDNQLGHTQSHNMARGLSGKTVDEVWREIQLAEKVKNEDVAVKTEKRPTYGEMTLEEFLADKGAFTETSVSPVMALDAAVSVTPRNFSQQILLSPALSLSGLSDTLVPVRRRDTPDAMERSIERKLKRKIKNRESAARSRARKQAYHNELVGKVSRLEVENIMLKKEKELEEKFSDEQFNVPRYQLRRTTSASF